MNMCHTWNFFYLQCLLATQLFLQCINSTKGWPTLQYITVCLHHKHLSQNRVLTTMCKSTDFNSSQRALSNSPMRSTRTCWSKEWKLKPVIKIHSGSLGKYYCKMMLSYIYYFCLMGFTVGQSLSMTTKFLVTVLSFHHIFFLELFLCIITLNEGTQCR